MLGLELDPELAAWGAANLDACDLPWARIEPATPGALGRPVDGGWDRILVSASPRSLPTVLVDQLADGGRLVIPVRSTMHLVERARRPDTCHHARLVHLRPAALRRARRHLANRSIRQKVTNAVPASNVHRACACV